MLVGKTKIEIEFFFPPTIKEVRDFCKELHKSQPNFKSVRPISFEKKVRGVK